MEPLEEGAVDLLAEVSTLENSDPLDVADGRILTEFRACEQVAARSRLKHLPFRRFSTT